MKACLALHDFSVVNNRFLWLFKLKDHFPKFKISLFTVPIDEKRDWGPYQIRKEYLTVLKENLYWIQLIPHGLTHQGSEMRNVGYDRFKKEILPAIDKAFAKDELPYEKGFCAPHWRWNAEVVRALDDSGWWGAVDKRQPQMLKTKKFYRYSHCINELWPNEDLKLHGHIYGTPNDLGICFDNFTKLPIDTEWHFITDFLEEA